MALVVAVALFMQVTKAEEMMAKIAWPVTPIIIVGAALTWLHAVVGLSVRELGESFERLIRDGLLRILERVFDDDPEVRNGPVEL